MSDLERTIESLRAVIRTHELKHQCEVLYAQGRVGDATGSLIEITNAANEPVRIDKLIADWLPAFTQKCVSTLERTGDEALDIKKHEEAIVAYSAVLSLNRSAPNTVLSKWASAVLACGTSNEALAAAAKFELPKFVIFRVICDVLERTGRVVEAVACFRQMENELAEDMSFHEEQAQWEPDFQRRCTERLEKLGDVAVSSRNYDEATGHFSTILSLDQTDCNHSTPNTAVVKWARSMLFCGSPNEALVAGTNFKLEKFVISRAICEVLEGDGRVMDAIAHFRRMKNELVADMSSHAERAQWELCFQRCCIEQLEKLGDIAVDSQYYKGAADYFSTILSLNPINRMDILVKRGKARALTNSLEQALIDAEEAIKLDPSCYRGYEMRHAILHGAKRYAEAVEAFDSMLKKIEESHDVDIREIRGRYVDARPTIRRIVQQIIQSTPRVLIDTATGRLDDKQHQAEAFEAHPAYSELVSSMMAQLNYARIWETVKEFYQYVMLSHERGDGEPLQNVKNISIYDLKASQANTELRRLCLLVCSLGFRWAWSDGSCVDNSNDIVLRESLIARFAWYRGSSLTIVYLRGVSLESLWNARPLLYQECIAARVIRFYTKDWKPYLGLTLPNHKESPDVISEIEQATGVSAREMALLHPGLDMVREKLFLASRYGTMPIEDTAYSLLGIFNIVIPVIYGEGNGAVGRLLEHVLTGSGDSTILAWTGNAGSYNSCLPADFTVYGSLVPPHVLRPIDDAEMNRIVMRLRSSLTDLSLATTFHDRLRELPPPTFVASRLRLPGIVFPLTGLVHISESTTLRVYRATTPTLMDVEIKTADDLTGMEGLCLVHPWIRPLLDEESAHDASAFDDVTRALRFVARLRQPFGALLFAPLSHVEYRRVAADSLIMVRIREDVSLSELINSVRRIEVL